MADDFQFARRHWTQIVRALEATYQYIDPATGLFNGTKTSDWGREGVGGTNAALNALYYRALVRTAHFSSILSKNPTNASSSSSSSDQKDRPSRWLATADRLKAAFNAHLWDASASLYRDNTTARGARLHPQDGNALALLFDLPLAADQSAATAAALSARLTPFGAPAPELPGAVSPFVSSHELAAQFGAAGRTGDAAPALRLLRAQWGYMLRAFSNATLVEGYSVDDGSLAYGFYGDATRFVSHAHGFATGPVYALMREVVGIGAVRGVDVDDGDGEWVVWPKVVGSGLREVRGGFATVRGWWAMEWRVVVVADRDRNGVVWEARIETPVGLLGTVYAPLFGECTRDTEVFLDGVDMECQDVRGAFVRIGNVAGGCHRVRVECYRN